MDLKKKDHIKSALVILKKSCIAKALKELYVIFFTKNI